MIEYPHIRSEYTDGKFVITLAHSEDHVVNINMDKLQTISKAELQQINIIIEETMVKVNRENMMIV